MEANRESKAAFVVDPAKDEEIDPECIYHEKDRIFQSNYVKYHAEGRISADECARQMTSHTASIIANGGPPADIYEAVSRLVGTIHHLAITNQEYQPEIIAVLEAIQRLPELQVPTQGEGADWVEIGKENHKLWADWPRFLPDLFDTYSYQEHLFYESQDSSEDTAKEQKTAVLNQWASVNAWVARLLATGNDSIGHPNFMRNASYRFLRVLDVEGHPHFEGEVPAAANLFKYASPVILRLCETSPPSSLQIGIYDAKPREYEDGKRVLWKGKTGYSLERWNWWKSRWAEISGGNYEADIRRHATSALASMKAAEEVHAPV